MNGITRFFLRAKPWQLFLLLVALPFAIQMAAMMNLMAGVDLATQETPFNAGISTAVFLLTTAQFYLCLLGWFRSMGLFLSSIVRPSLKMSTRFFLFSLIYPFIYLFVFAAVFNFMPVLFVFLLPFHLFAMYCILYPLYFISKNLVMAELGKPVTFSGYATAFFLIWFFPIGIWFIQPRINSLYKKSLISERSSEASAI